MNCYTKSTRRLIKTSIFLFLLSATSVFAQDEEFFTISLEMLTDLNSISNKTNIDSNASEKVPVYFTESADVKLTPKGDIEKEVIPSYFRHHKSLDQSFSGYVIELLQSDEKLERNFPLFERFGSVYMQQLENGKYSYCIIANFKKSKSLKIFVNEVIIPHAPEAKALKYKRGKRKTM
ncbi:MAG: hypothetical protein AB8F94_05475 [Saprospiraceae bacterium]